MSAAHLCEKSPGVLMRHCPHAEGPGETLTSYPPVNVQPVRCCYCGRTGQLETRQVAEQPPGHGPYAPPEHREESVYVWS